MPWFGLGHTCDMGLNLGQIDECPASKGNGHLRELAIQVNGRLAHERDELLGRLTRDRHALALRELLHLLGKLAGATRRAIDDGLLVDLGNRLVQTRVLGELLGNERENGRVIGILEIRDDGF